MSAADVALPLPESELVLESAIAPLEAAVREGGAAAGRAASRLLRAYRIYPARLNRDVVVASLAQALTALPRNDFQLALYLLPAALRGDAAIASLQERERELQSGSFVAFWAGLKDPALAGPLASAGGFENGVRQFMLGALNRVYQRIEAEELGKQLNLSAVRCPRASSIRDVLFLPSRVHLGPYVPPVLSCICGFLCC